MGCLSFRQCTPNERLWPEQLIPLLRLHGEKRLFKAGVSALGYPAILCTTPAEIEAIRREIARQEIGK